jgi:hypothetical protein
LLTASTNGLPHWLDAVYLRRQLAAADTYGDREGDDYWAGRQPPYISVFYKKRKSDDSLSLEKVVVI